MNRNLTAVMLLMSLAACRQVDLFERHTPIPGHAWSSDFKPEFRFEIGDTATEYRLFVFVRHSDAYGYNNLWLNITSRQPGESDSTVQRFDLPLATNEKWTGTGMDDIFEHRILLYRKPVKFRLPGPYSVRIEHLMREDPLKHVMNIGFRIEKSKP